LAVLSFSGVSPRPPLPTLFPYTTLFRSHADRLRRSADVDAAHLDPVRSAQEGGALVVQQRVHPGAHPGGDERGRVPGTDEVLHRSEEHTSELQSRFDLVCRLLLEKKNKT